MVPLTQLFDGYAETIGDGHEGVGLAKRVTLLACGGDRSCDGDDELIAGFNGVCGGDLVVGSDLGCASVKGRRDLVEGLTRLDDVEAPCCAVLFRDFLEPVEEDVVGAGRDVKVVGYVRRGGET